MTGGRTVVVTGAGSGLGRAMALRLDGGFATPRILAAIEQLKVEYVVGMPESEVLKREVAMTELGGESRRSFDSFRYRARSWRYARRVVAKVEAVVHAGQEVKRNPRFVVSNLRQRPEAVNDIYTAYGDRENCIKELRQDLKLDRTKCSSFRANVFRVLLTATAHALFRELRWRLRLRYVGVRVVVSSRSRPEALKRPSSETATGVVGPQMARGAGETPLDGWVRSAIRPPADTHE